MLIYIVQVLYCVDLLCRYPQQMQLGSIGTTGEGRDIKVGRKNMGLCNDSPKYFACHVITYKILLLNLFLYNCKHIQVVKMNVNSSLPTIFIDAGIQS